MGLFSSMKRSLAAAEHALRLVEEQARQASMGHGGDGSSISVGNPPDRPPTPPPTPPPMTPPGTTGPTTATETGATESIRGWATAGATTPYVGPPPAATIQRLIDASAPPPRATRRWWPVVALPLAIAGGVVLTIGIIGLVGQNDKVRSGAIVTGEVGALGEPADTYQFTVDEAQAYSVYVDLDTNNENVRDTIVGATECTAAFQDGTTAQIRGSRQASSSNIGDLSSIGYFDAPEGAAAIRCTQQPFGRRSASGRLDDRHPFYVSPGTTNNFGGIGWTLGGATLLALAMLVAIKGHAAKPTTPMRIT